MIKILVPVDFSENSLNALRYAIRFFRSANMAITVLFSYKTTSTAFHMKSMDRILREDAEKKLDDLLEKMQKEEPDIPFIPKIVKGNPVSVITSVGDKGGYDLVVMGTKGATGLKEVFMGSVAGGVIAEIEAPVLVVPSDYKYIPIDKIMLGMSESPISSTGVFDPLRMIVKIHDCGVNVVHFTEEKKPAKLHPLDLIQDLDPAVTYVIGTGNINQRLNNYIEENEVGLLCLVRSKRGYLDRLFGKSVTTERTFHSPIPLLILHE